MKKILITGTAILHQKDDVTPEGLQKTFATNVFGHFLMVQFCNVGTYLIVNHVRYDNWRKNCPIRINHAM